MMCILLIAERASVEATEGFLIVRPAMGTIEFAANAAIAASRVASSPCAVRFPRAQRKNPGRKRGSSQ